MKAHRELDKAPFYNGVADGPEPIDAFWVEAVDGVRLRVAQWRSRGQPKGSVFIFQGRTEIIEKYGRTAKALQNFGYDVFSVDWRGQGFSDRLSQDRMLGHVDAYSDYQLDVAAGIETANRLNLPKPWFLLGHSLGACIGLRAVMDGFPVNAAAFTAPLWGINISRLQTMAAWPLTLTASVLGKGLSYAPGTAGESYVLTTSFEQNRLTHDPDMYQYYVAISEELKDQQLGGPSMQWLLETLRETRTLSKAPSPRVPCITFCGALDTIVAMEPAVDRMAYWAGGQLEIIPKAKHDVLHELPNIRTTVLADIDTLFTASM